MDHLEWLEQQGLRVLADHRGQLVLKVLRELQV